jgi:uncharacterized protein
MEDRRYIAHRRRGISLGVLFLSSIIYLLSSISLLSVGAQDFQIPQPTGNAVNDFAGVIDQASKQRLETMLTNLKQQQNIEFAVVTVKTTGGRDIFEYALELGRRWGIGPSEGEKQGLLLLVAVDDRKYYTLVSRHLQGELTDGMVGSLQRQYLVPALRAGNYGEGLLATAHAYIDTLAAKRGFSTAGIYQADDRRAPVRPPPSRTRSGSGFSTCGLIIIVAVVLIIILAASRGRGGGSGCLNMLLLGSLFSSLGRGGSDGGWGGGGFGDSGGSDGGGFGGFGGGGDFDGGGAGGSW